MDYNTIKQAGSDGNLENVDIGIPYGEAKGIHLNALYDIRRRISAVTENAGITGTNINYDVIYALVEQAISLIPDVDQGNRCRELLYKKEREERKHLQMERKHEIPTSEDINDAKRQASMVALQLVQVIFDDDIGIRKRHTVGVA